MFPGKREIYVQAANERPMENVTLIFEEGASHLSNAESEILRTWVCGWFKQSNAPRVVLGGVCETSRAGLLRRMHALVELLAQFGIPSKRIGHDPDWDLPSRMGAMTDLPSDVVWIQANRNLGG